MRRSLLLRLFGLSVSVAVLAIAATAWLTTQNAAEQVRGEFERTMEADSFVYQQLLSYAHTQDSWDDVQALIDELAARTGQRVALTTLDGVPIADSASPEAELPQTAAAEIDARASYPIVASSSSGGPVSGGVGISWQITEDDLAAQEAAACAEAADADGFVDIETDATGMLTCTMTSGVPTEAALEYNQRETELLTVCLNDARVSFNAITDESGMSQLIIDQTDDEGDAVSACIENSFAEAIEPFVADPALLYLGEADRFDALSGDGLIRMLLTGTAVLAVAGGVTALAGRRLVRPIHALTAAAQQVATGNRGARVPVIGRDEVARLGHAFNAMAESIESSEQQRKAMVSDVAHELRTPLANVRGYLEAAEDGVVPLDSALVSSLLEESALLQRLVDDLQDLALADAGMLRLHREQCDVADLARQVGAAHRARADERDLTLVIDAGAPVTVAGDPVRLRQALGNLIANAVQYTPAGGEVRISVRRDGDEAVLVVSDTGSGIDPEHLPFVFDRFYRADPSRNRATGGSGLGLAITKHLVEVHGGTVQVASDPGDGAEFTIRVPACTAGIA